MHDQRQVVNSVRPGSKSPIEILGYLQQLSRDAADGNVTRVLDAAVELPVSCLAIEKAVLLCRSPGGASCIPTAWRNLSQEFLDNCHVLSDDGITDSVLAAQGPKIVEDISSLPPRSADLCAAEGVRSFTCIPAVVRTGASAVLVCMCSDRAPLAVWEVELLNTIANHVAAALRLRQADELPLPAETRSSFEQLKETVSSYTDLQDLLDTTLDGVLNILQAESGSIMLHEEGGYRVAASRGLQHDVLQRLHAPGDGAVSTRVIVGRDPILLHGAADTREFPGAVPRPELISAISVPLKGKRRIIGLLNVNSTRPGRLLTDEELTYVSTIAHHVAITVENAKLYQAASAQTRYLGNLYKIARTITSTLQLDIVLEMITERLRTLIASDVCGLLLHGQETGRIQLSSGYGIPDGTDQDYIDLMLPAVKLSAGSRRPVVIPDLAAHPAYADVRIAQSLGLRSAAVTPLTIKRKVVGFVAAYRREPRGFPRHIVRLLLGLAELAAIAIENARLYERQSAIAHITQRDLAPQGLEPIPNFDIGCKYAPAHQVGGDYYDVIKLGGQKFGIAIADVAGKDVTAALHITMCKHALRALAEHLRSPAQLLQKMNRFIYEHTEPEAFISMIYAVLDAKRGTLAYSTAGHEPGLLLRAEATRIEQISTPGILLGVVPDATFGERQTSMNSGDILLLYTDGLVEALSPQHLDALTVLETALKEALLKPAQELADNLHRLAVAVQTGRSPDDIALVALRKI